MKNLLKEKNFLLSKFMVRDGVFTQIDVFLKDRQGDCLKVE